MVRKAYSDAEIYDIAFDFRDWGKDCDFLGGVFRRLTGREPGSFLELAAGPGRYAIEFARWGLRSLALDNDPRMAAYGKELSEKEGVELDYMQADMRDFPLKGPPIDLAYLPLDSITHLLDNDSVLAHLRCVANALNGDGIYVIEMGHPSDVWGVSKRAENVWEMERGGVKVKTTWGGKDDPFDPIRQVTDVKVVYEIEGPEGKRVMEEIHQQRKFTKFEIEALVAASGLFEIVEMYGALDMDIGLEHLDAWRMIPVLKAIDRD